MTITLGIIRLAGADAQQLIVRNAAGEQVALLWSGQPQVDLLAGEYEIEIGDRRVRVTVKEGETVEVGPQ